MAVDERGRLQLADAAKRAFGDEAGITLMELLPPVGWADVATKHDLDLRFDALEARMDARFAEVEHRFDRFELALLAQVDQRLKAQSWVSISTIIAAMGIIVAAVRL